MTIAGETARNNGLKFWIKRFICILIGRFISLNFLSTSLALSFESLPAFFLFENFMSLFGCFWIWTPTCFLEVICPRFDPDDQSQDSTITSNLASVRTSEKSKIQDRLTFVSLVKLVMKCNHQFYQAIWKTTVQTNQFKRTIK